MKTSEIVCNRTVTCELCGRDFVVTSKFSRAKRCPECVISIRNGEKHEGFSHKSIIGKRKVNVSKLDTLAREAKEHGMSYGKYVSLKRAGYKVEPITYNVGTNPAWEAWRTELYAIVAAGKARAECHGQ